MKFYFILLTLLGVVNSLLSQQYLNYQLRLEPVWTRVADAMGELGSVESVEFSKDGKYIVSGAKYDNSVIMWRTSDGQELWRKYTKEEIERVGWSSDGKYVAAASEDYLVKVYDANNGELIKTLEHSRGIDGLIWSHQGKILATGEERSVNDDGTIDGWIRIFDINQDKEITILNFGETVNELFFTQDDNYLLAVGHGSVKIYSTDNWKLDQTLAPEEIKVFTSGVFSPDGSYVIAVGQAEGARGNVYLWNWKKGELLRKFNHTGKKIESISWHPNGAYIAHAGHDPYIYVYRIKDILGYSNDEIPVAHKVWASDHAEYIDFNSDGSFLASAHQNGTIKLWVWMGEDPALNKNRHKWIKTQQTDAKK